MSKFKLSDSLGKYLDERTECHEFNSFMAADYILRKDDRVSESNYIQSLMKLLYTRKLDRLCDKIYEWSKGLTDVVKIYDPIKECDDLFA